MKQKRKKEKSKNVKQGSSFEKAEKSQKIKKMNWKIIKTITTDGETIHNPPCEVYLFYTQKNKKHK